MKLIFKTVLSCFIAVSIFACGKAEAKDHPIVKGSFIQSGLCVSWNAERWKQEFDMMKEAGLEYLVLQAVVYSAPEKESVAFYPTKISGIVPARDVKDDMLDLCLSSAEEAGIKVFIGIESNDKWWDAPYVDSTWLYKQMRIDNAVCDELWSLYKAKYPSAFYGWYWAYEVANWQLTEGQKKTLINAMNMQLDHLASTGEKLPFMWCPFMNSKIGTPHEYKDFWIDIFVGIHTTDGDIFASQDCVGAGGLNIDEVDEWFAALSEAVKTKPGLLFWSDVENFDQKNWSSATLDRFIRQMKIEEKYVSEYITFSYNHYYSPFVIDSGFHETYVDYLLTGKLENISPSKPLDFNADVVDGVVELNWSPSTDNIGVCGYYIFRNGNEISDNHVIKIHSKKNASFQINSFVDKSISSGTYLYQVQAYDFAGNLSDKTKGVEVSVP